MCKHLDLSGENRFTGDDAGGVVFAVLQLHCATYGGREIGSYRLGVRTETMSFLPGQLFGMLLA